MATAMEATALGGPLKKKKAPVPGKGLIPETTTTKGSSGIVGPAVGKLLRPNVENKDDTNRSILNSLGLNTILAPKEEEPVKSKKKKSSTSSPSIIGSAVNNLLGS